MPSYTNSLRLVQPATGEYSGTWGTEVNNGLTALVDASIAGTSNITMTAGHFPLTSSNGAADQSRAMFLVLGGTPGGSYQVICPAVSKLYFVTNNTGFAQTVTTYAGSGISVPNGARMTLRCDGTDVVAAQNYFASLTLGAALPVNSGGTGLTSYTSGGVVYASSTSALATGSALTFNGTGLGVGIASALGNLDVYTAATSIGYVRTANQTLKLTADDAGNRVDIANVAGNPLSFTMGVTERMRLDSSGNLGLGNTPSASIAGTTIEVGVNKSGAFGALGSGPVDNAYVSANAYPTGSADPAFTSWKYTRTGFAAKYESGNGGAHRWYTAPSGTAGAAISFTQAMTLTNGGDLLVGTSTLSGAGGISLQSQSGTGFAVINNNNAGATGYVFESFRRSGLEIGSVMQNGTTAVLYNTTSDRRLKDNIVPAPSASDVIDAIEIVSHDWKAAPDEHVTYGVIAQDLHAVVPQAVLQGDDGEEVEKTWGVDYSKLVPMLIKEIQQLRARVAALEQA